MIRTLGKKLHPVAIASVITLCVVVACGGSSSETPPPLEPSPQVLSGPAAGSPERRATPPAEDREDDSNAPRARGTWGTGRVHTDGGAPFRR